MDPRLTPTSIIIGIIFGMIAGYLAFQRKRNPYLWFFLGFTFGIFGIFALIFSPKKKRGRKRGQTTKRKEPPELLVGGPVDKFWFYLDPSHKQVGPVSHSTIAKAFHQGQISKTTYVWHENLNEWKKLEELITQ